MFNFGAYLLSFYLNNSTDADAPRALSGGATLTFPD